MLYFQITIKEPHKKPKPRASFRMKKGISRKPLHATTKKEPIKPAENKASRLRAQKIQEAENTDTPRSRSGSHHKNIEKRESLEETNYINNQNTPPEPRFQSSAIKTPAPGSTTNGCTPPPKPQRARLHTTPTPNNSRPSSLKKTLPDRPKSGKERTPSPETPITDLDKSPKFSKRFSGKTQKFPPAPSPTVDKEPPFTLNFIPIHTPSEPSEVVKRTQIDEVKRKRKITRPTSNIFESFDNDCLPSSPSTPDIKLLSAEKCDDLTSKSFEGFPAKEAYPINTEPTPTKSMSPCLRRTERKITPRTPPRTPPSKSIAIPKPKSLAIPKPTKSAPSKSRNNLLSAKSRSFEEAGSDLECSGSSVEDSPPARAITDKKSEEDSDPLPMLDLSFISSEDLSRIMNQLKSPRNTKGSLRARRKVRSSWCVADSTFLDDKVIRTSTFC